MKNHSTLDRPPGDRDNAVGLMRFVLTSLVILSHSFHFYGVSHTLDPMARATWAQYTLGRLAVDAFFVLSGFLVARSWETSRGLTDFLKKRAARVYPGFFVAIAFATLVAAPWLVARGGTAAWSAPFWSGIALPALMLDYGNLGVNGSLWTIRYDFYYYLFIGMVGWAGMFSKRWPVLAMWAASWLVYASWFKAGLPAGIDEQHPRLLTCFLAGAVCYAYRHRIPVKWSWFAVSMAVLVLYSEDWSYRYWPYRLMPVIFPIFGTYAVLFAAFRPGARAAKFAWLGDYSYGLFLYAYPVQLILLTAYRSKLNSFTLFLSAWAIAGALAFLSLYLVERPIMRLSRKGSTPRRATPPPHFSMAEEPRVVATVAVASTTP
ncbi:acyltransferase family protein [Planctomyces sp. SH-PL62]|uniref:acyltransferase family protein n=1 Tax=Planctomyces sp. SH-PL62 TaxID=1636152 RepID=UPI0018D2D23F|nr:acyltransferase [Planctomyces sp. SH-PL62]